VIDNILQPASSLVSMLKIALVAGLLWENQRNGLHSLRTPPEVLNMRLPDSRTNA
jgi:hypothetical protein